LQASEADVGVLGVFDLFKKHVLIWTCKLPHILLRQYFFDVFNSIPVAIVLFLIFLSLKIRWAQLLTASACLHMLCDLPVHHDDGHRHFLPISNWRFESPVSYWDPEHFGLVFAALELTFAIAGLIYVVRKGETPTGRFAIGTLAIYAIGIALLTFVLSRPFFCSG